jgi:hypothetical protein
MTSIKLHQKLILDKVAITMPIVENERLPLLKRINEPDLYEPYNRKVYRSGGRYKNNYQFTIHDGETIELAMYPIHKGHNFLRLEYNPTKLGKEGRKKLRSFLIKLLGINVVKSIYFKATVTRLDLTLDIFDMEPNLYIYKKKVEQSQVFRGKENNTMVSQVLGSDSSNCRITMYDKHLEQGIEGNTNYQRIEVRLRKLNTTMADLSEALLSQIKALNFFNADSLTDTRFTKKFKREAKADGINSALMALDDNTRRRYLRHLENYRVFPIDLDNLDFGRAHRIALGSLLHPDLRDQAIARKAA